MENSDNENRNELNAIVSVLGDVVVEIKEMRGAFDRSFTLVLNKLDKLDNIEKELKELNGEVRSVRSDLGRMTDYEERIKALETAVFRKGA